METFYWVNPYDILAACYSSKDKHLAERTMEGGGAKKQQQQLPPVAAASSWRGGMLRHTVPCADRR